MTHNVIKAIRNPKRFINRMGIALQSFEKDAALERLWNLAQTSRYSDSKESLQIDSMRIRCHDRLSLALAYKDIFQNRIYDFNAVTDAPRILDCGSFIGLSILFFKRKYPDAVITGFEPDSNIREMLLENLELNQVVGVEVVDAALSISAGEAAFNRDVSDGGQLNVYAPQTFTPTESVKTVCLSDYLNEPVDMLKMNIEGAEVDVLREAQSKLGNVREMVIEYHNFEYGPQRLHELLELLASNGFKYLVNHFDYVSNPGVKPPFRIDDDTRYFLLIYACRV